MHPLLENNNEYNTEYNSDTYYADSLNNPKKRFSTELELVESISDIFLTSFTSTNQHYVKEFNCTDGIADLILFESKKDWSENLSVGNIPPRWAYALVNLPLHNKFNLSYFSSTTRVSKTTALSVINLFTQAGFCKKLNEEKNTWIKIKQPIPTVKNIIAIEAKLRNWSRALTQAYRYLDYANQSWVLLDTASIKPALTNIERFKQLNIGLASIDACKQLSIHYNPTNSSPKSEISFWHANSKITKEYFILNNFYNNN